MRTKLVVDELERSYWDGEVTNLPIASLVKALAGSCDFNEYHPDSWLREAFYYKMEDKEIGYLIDSILDDGLTLPLNILRREHGFVMGNGHHRLVAALLCGVERLDVVVTDNVDWYHSADDRLEPDWVAIEDSYKALKWIIQDIRTDIASLIVL